MEQVEAGIPIVHQWAGYYATLAGTLLSLVGLIASVVAARKAMSAARAADGARVAVLQIVHASQLDEILSEMYELGAMIQNRDVGATSLKTTRIIGRIARFNAATYTQYSVRDRSLLDDCAVQLEAIHDVAVRSSLKVDTQVERMMRGYSNAIAALNRVAGNQQQSLVEGVKSRDQ